MYIVLVLYNLISYLMLGTNPKRSNQREVMHNGIVEYYLILLFFATKGGFYMISCQEKMRMVGGKLYLSILTLKKNELLRLRKNGK